MSTAFFVRCATLLFDLDGALVDSTACIERIWNQWASQHGLDLTHVIDLAHGRRTFETIQLVAPQLAADREVAALAKRESRTTDGVFEVPGARELLHGVPRSRWAIVTSGIRAVATLRMQHARLPLPDVLICADDIQRGKPDPEGYLTAAQRLGVAPSACVVIEDAPAGLEAARAAGMRSIAISGTYPPDALTMADQTISHLRDLQITSADERGLLDIHVARG